MKQERDMIKCPWCQMSLSVKEVKVTRKKNHYGMLVERKCSGCGKVLAAYLDDEGEFLTRIRTF